ncbi:MAG: hypothetical protein QM667_05515 [Asticcacaulis sp.]
MKHVPLHRPLHRFGIVFAVFSLLTLGLGALVMQQSGLGAGLWLRNPVAWLIGAALCFGLSRLRLSLWPLCAGVLLLTLTFLNAGSEGVHRWLALGPVQINAAALILPLILSGTAFPETRLERTLWFGGMAIIATLLALQPDLSQLAAFGAAILVLILIDTVHGPRPLLAAVSVSLLAVLVCLFRPDPLASVAHVEGIVFMAWAQSPPLAIALCLCLLLSALSPLLLWNDRDRRPRAAALSACFLLSGVAWIFGAFPVPLAGYGVSFVLGWWLGVSGLMMPARTTL